MKTKLNYKTKNNILLLIAVIVLLFTYNFYITDTIHLVSDYNRNSDSLMQTENAVFLKQELKMKLRAVESRAGMSDKKDLDFQQQLLEIISRFSQQNKTVIRSIPQVSSYKEKDLLVESNVFVMEGSFRQLLSLLYLLEQKERIGKIASVKFKKETDLKTKKTYLLATYYLQNINKVQ
jgi:hypothetical protein